jgi:ADP-ribose pyrophosphatase YjhB (NUDIX family)
MGNNIASANHAGDAELPNGRSRALIIGVHAAILTATCELLLVERADLPFWCLPGGLMSLGESVVDAVARECAEEIGVAIRVERLVGIYSDPSQHLFRLRNGHIKQFVSLVFAASIVNGTAIPHPPEVKAVAYFTRSALPPIVPSHLVWVEDAFDSFAPPQFK